MERRSISAERQHTLLVLRAQSGDRSALDDLLAAHQRPLYRYLERMLRNHSDAEDALQATLLQASKKLRFLREPSLFRAWAYRIASRQAYRAMRSRKRRHEMTNLEMMDQFPHSEAEVTQSQELVEQIPAWLGSLTAKGREALILHYLDGFTTEQTAEILNVPIGTVKSRVSYSLAQIRKRAAQRKVEP